MARFLLLLRRLFGRGMRGGVAALTLGLAVVGQAHASGTVPALPGWKATFSAAPGETYYGQTQQAVCPQVATKYQEHLAAGVVVTWSIQIPQSNPGCRMFTNGTSADFYQLDPVNGPPSTLGVCPANTTATFVSGGTTCTCGTGFSPGTGALTGLCVPPTNCPAGSTVSSGVYDWGSDGITAYPAGGCVSGCAYTYDGLSAQQWTLVNGVRHYFASGAYVSTGGKCGAGVGDPTNAAPPPTAASAPPAPTCAAGSAVGYVNGDPVCAPVGAPSGTASSPATGSPPLQDSTACTTTTAGTVTTKACTTTYASGAKGTTTTTTDSSNGSSSTVSTGANSTGGIGAIAPGIPASGAGGGGTGGGGPGGCADNSSAAGCGGAAGGTPSSYTGKDKTVSGVLTARRDQFMASGVGAATSGFWSVSGNGTCPLSTWSIPYVNATVPFNVMCSSWALDMLDKMKWVVLIVFAWYAFRICLD